MYSMTRQIPEVPKLIYSARIMCFGEMRDENDGYLFNVIVVPAGYDDDPECVMVTNDLGIAVEEATRLCQYVVFTNVTTEQEAETVRYRTIYTDV